MAHHAYIKGATTASWQTGTVISSSEWATIDSYLYGAIDGDTGGAWAPSSPIVIGGAGISLVATATFAGLVNCTGNVNLGNNSGDTINVYGIANLSAANVGGYISMYGGAYFGGTGSAYAVDVDSTWRFYCPVVGATATFSGPVSAGSLAVGGDINIGGNSTLGNNGSDSLTVNATATFASSVTVSAAASFASAITAGATATFNGPVLLGDSPNDITWLAGPLMTYGNGSIQLDFIQLDDADHTIGASPHIILQGAMSANRALKLSAPTVGTGSPFKFIRCADATYYLMVQQGDGTPIFALGNGYSKSAIVYFNGTTWQPIMFGT